MDACPHRDRVAFFRHLGYLIRLGPCRDCAERRRCAYRRLFTCRANRRAQVLILTAWHLQREDLWTRKALRNRPLVLLDEDALSALAAPVELTVERLRRFTENLHTVRAVLGDAEGPEVAWLTRRLSKPTAGEQAALAATDVLRRAAEDLLRACATAGRGQWRDAESMPHQVLNDYDRALIDDDEVFHTLVRAAYEAARRQAAIPNLAADLRALLRRPRPVYVSSEACRWSRPAFLPASRHVVMLDATAEPSVVAGVTGRRVRHVETPAVAQQATIYQVMDKIASRAGLRRDTRHTDGWALSLAREVARRHRGTPMLCVTFKNREETLRELLDEEHGAATVIHYGALRGLNAFEDFGAGLILGRPMPNEAQLQLLAVAAFGREALDGSLRPPALAWQLDTRRIGPDTWQLRRQQYADPRWQAVWRHVVTGELTQAIGRLRPLTNPATIYVASNEPLPDTLHVAPVYAAELFPAMVASSRRSDLKDRVRRYAEAMAELAAAGQTPTNRAVCARLGIAECNGHRYRKFVPDRPRPP